MRLLSSDSISNSKKHLVFNKHVFILPYTICHYWHFQVEIIAQIYMLHKFLKNSNGDYNANNTIIFMTTPQEPKTCLPYLYEYCRQLHLLDEISSKDNSSREFPMYYLTPDTPLSVPPNFSIITPSKTTIRGSVPALFALDVMYELARSYEDNSVKFFKHKYIFIGKIRMYMYSYWC
ncbi:hypothetical protein EON65_24795 [archaeon]|nr:MAG: hypothetical protein EON65_24795 [archaeon]